jgi:TetR/AcrR family transcriptional regulator, ethionamide resistance regulator
VSASGQRTRQREQRDQTRHQVLRAAERFLRRRPFRELSVDVVMADTGLTRTGFYRHFDDLTELVLRLLDGMTEELQAVAMRWAQQAGAGYPVAAREAIAAIVEFFVAHGTLVRAMSEATASDVRIELAYRHALDGLVELTTLAIGRLRDERGLEVPDARAMALALNLMNEAYLLHEFGREPVGDPQAARATLESVWLRVLGPPQ